jgi:hypothetical protein
LLRRKSNVAAAIQRWRDVVDKKRGAGEAGRMTSKSRLASDPEERKAFKNAGLLIHLGRVANLVFAGRDAVPAWHDTPFVMAW